MTQNTPTQRSATAKLAKKKFVMDLNLRDIVTTNITRRFPKMSPDINRNVKRKRTRKKENDCR